MNWFRKLFAQLNDDVEQESIEQSYAEKPEQKKMQAKVSYQYPTGKFRFPLNLDTDEVEQKRTTHSPSVRQARNSAKTPTPNKQQRQAEAPTPPKKESKPKIKVAEKKKEEVKVKNKKPFHPTEVVSPVFGYSLRPPVKKQEEIIPEIELVSMEEEYINVRTETAVTIDTIEKTESEKVQNFSNELLHEEKEEVAVTVLEHEDETETIKQGLESQSQVTEMVIEHLNEETLEFEESYACDENVQVQHIDEDEYLSASVVPDGVIVEEEDIVPASVEQSESQKSSSDAKPSLDSDVTRQKDYKKQHIPYNVIMLKQDKRTLEKRKQVEEQPVHYVKPPIRLLNIPPQHSENDREWVEAQKQLLDETLHHFRVGAKVVKATQGPSVTQFEVQPDPGVKVNKITNLSDDIKLSLSARDIRIEAPIPGKNTIGIEVPNRVSKSVLIREIIRHPSFIQNSSPLTVALGLDISGQPVVLDLQKMPHGLIAGATGSGKSVCVNSIIISLLYKSNPDEVKLLLVDPKMVELTPYNHIPHLVCPVITDVKAATAALKWAVEEMERRYALFVHAGVRDIAKYNEGATKHNQEKLPYMVIIIDELADLMMVAPSDVEEAICRIAQKARACGMHLLIATQRPSVDVITGLIKANIPTRIAFSVSSQVDSRTIIDIGGAERLLGKGDMLLLENGAPKPIRVQGNFVSDEEIERAVSHVRKEQKPTYLFEQTELLKESSIQEEDELFLEACQFVIDQNVASTSSLQRRFRIGYNRAARLMELMEDQGVISGPKGSKPRDVLLSEEELANRKD
ncbi:DNA translocase FtsK [Sutcliffiella halmapala]|uniref:DNA translocase FtsK n=1 Tax=Sutcliffiella halmapala TaxID=79882 RepID=UPI001F2C16AA|nr:DNA translocase FtsK [Sutcliffiella halmapala]